MGSDQLARPVGGERRGYASYHFGRSQRAMFSLFWYFATELRKSKVGLWVDEDSSL